MYAKYFFIFGYVIDSTSPLRVPRIPAPLLVAHLALLDIREGPQKPSKVCSRLLPFLWCRVRHIAVEDEISRPPRRAVVHAAMMAGEVV